MRMQLPDGSHVRDHEKIFLVMKKHTQNVVAVFLDRDAAEEFASDYGRFGLDEGDSREPSPLRVWPVPVFDWMKESEEDESPVIIRGGP